MPLNYKYLNTRIQLKCDTQDNWDSTDQVALEGEIIIYAPDTPTGTHAYARLKVGDGETQIKNLPFIDAGTINGKIIEEVIQIYDTYSNFPALGDGSNHGDQKSLYVDKNSGKIFYWDGTQYVQIGGITYNITYTNIKAISSWQQGTPVQFTANENNNHTLIITSGSVTTLSTSEYQVVTGLTAQ